MIPDLVELANQREGIERQIREVKRNLLEECVGKNSLSATFLTDVEGTLDSLPGEDIPEGYSKDQLRQIVKQDEGWQALKQELDVIQSEYKEYLNERNLTDTSYKEQVKSIKQEYGHNLSSYQIAKFVGCSHDYVRGFTVSFKDGSVREPRSGTDIAGELRRKVFNRDTACVRCSSDSNLEIHHIVPVSRGGESLLENLALLCRDCHLNSHDDSWNGDVQYDSTEEFWSWVTGR